MWLWMPPSTYAATNIGSIDSFPGSVLGNWSGNSGITDLDSSTTVYEGTYSLAVSYSIDNVQRTATIQKSLSSLNGSSYSGIQFRLKGPDVYGDYKLRLTTDVNGAPVQWETVNMLLGKNDWKQVFIPYSHFRNSSDLNTEATSLDMSAITELAMDFTKTNGDPASVVTGTLYVDDIKFVDDRIDDYENGLSGYSGDAYTTVAGETSLNDVYEGEQSLKLSYDFGSEPDGTVGTVTRLLAGEADASEFNGVSFWMKGDHLDNKMFLSFHTASGTTFTSMPVELNTGSKWKPVAFYWGQFFTGSSYTKPTAADLAEIDEVYVHVMKYGQDSSVIYLDNVSFTLRSDLFANLNYSGFPGLSAVKSYVDEGDYQHAKAALLTYMQARTSPTYYYNWQDKTSIMNTFKTNYPYEIDANVDYADHNAKTYDFTFEGDHRQLDPDGDNDIDWYQGNTVFTSYLSRTGWWLDLGKAYWNSYLTTADESYVMEFKAGLRDFVQDVPRPNVIVNYVPPTKSQFVESGNLWVTLVAGIRLDNWIAAYHYFNQSPSFTAEDNYVFLQSLLEHTEYLIGSQESFRQSNNFQIVESYGIFESATMFPEFSKAAEWKATAKDLLEQQLDNSVLGDGFHTELTFGYHEWMLDNFYKSKVLGDVNQDAFHPNFEAKLEKMFEVDMKMMDARGYTPPISDSAPYYRRHYLSLGAAIYSRGDFKYLSDNKISSVHFWTTPTSIMNNLNLVAAAEPDFLSTRLEDSQYYYMRTDWRDGGNNMIVDGAPYLGGHFHIDAMSIIAGSDGDQLIVDPGKGNYGDRDYYPSYFAFNPHNAIAQDGQRNPVIDPIENVWETNAEYDYVDLTANYDAAPSPVPYSLSRKIYFAKPNYWVMNDLVSASGTHDYEQQFHLAPSAISIDKTTKAVEVNNTIDDYESNDLGHYAPAATSSLSVATTEKAEGERSLKVDYDLSSGYSWFRKIYDYQAQHVSGLTFWLKGNSTSNVVKPYILTANGNWVATAGISLDYTGWREYWLPWRSFDKEGAASLKMGALDARDIQAVDFHLLGSGTGTIYLDDVSFYDSYDISSFESERIADFDTGSYPGWAPRTGTMALDTSTFYEGAGSLKFTADFSIANFDYVRKNQSYNASDLAGITVAIKGTGTPVSFMPYIGSNTGIWRGKQTYSLNYSGWKVFYLPWESLRKESNVGQLMTSSDAQDISFVEIRINQSSSTNLYTEVNIDSMGFYDDYQLKDTTEMGLDTWSAVTDNVDLSLDSSVAFEGGHALKMDYELTGSELEAEIVKTGSYIASFKLYEGLMFRLKGNGDANQQLRVLINDYISPDIALSQTDWTTVFIPWSDFKLEKDSSIVMGEPSMNRLAFRVIQNGGSSSGTVYVDAIGFRGAEKANMTILPANPSEISEVKIYSNWVYYNAGRYEAGPVIGYQKHDVTGDTAYHTVIVPGAKGMSPDIEVSSMNVTQYGNLLTSNEALGLALTIEEDGHTYRDYYFASYSGTNEAKRFGSVCYSGDKAYIRTTDGAVTQVVKDEGELLYDCLEVDDFDTGGLSADWSVRGDGSSVLTLDTSEAAESSVASGKVAIQFAPGSPASAYTYIRNNPAADVDVSDYAGIMIRVKGQSSGYALTSTIVTNYNDVTKTFYYQAEPFILDHSGWQSYYMPWSSFGALSNNLDELQSLDFVQFQFSKQDAANADTADLYVDQIFFAKPFEE
ncbi:CIA30 family protein [Paenibacillus sp. J5C_2022]|nr:CIA30 family protein [Paenibacillus sp. J5C2022]